MMRPPMTIKKAEAVARSLLRIRWGKAATSTCSGTTIDCIKECPLWHHATTTCILSHITELDSVMTVSGKVTVPLPPDHD